MKSHIEVAAAIIFHGEKILISQRGPESHLSGYWEFPGGKRECEETFEECLRREILEELNVEVAVGHFFDEITYEYSEKIVSLKFYFCRYLSGTAEALGCQQFKWVLVEELAAYRFPPADEPVLAKLLAHGRRET
jgi:8-oxo-dGTP diphosphatase